MNNFRTMNLNTENGRQIWNVEFIAELKKRGVAVDGVASGGRLAAVYTDRVIVFIGKRAHEVAVVAGAAPADVAEQFVREVQP